MQPSQCPFLKRTFWREYASNDNTADLQANCFSHNTLSEMQQQIEGSLASMARETFLQQVGQSGWKRCRQCGAQTRDAPPALASRRVDQRGGLGPPYGCDLARVLLTETLSRGCAPEGSNCWRPGREEAPLPRRSIDAWASGSALVCPVAQTEVRDGKLLVAGQHELVSASPRSSFSHYLTVMTWLKGTCASGGRPDRKKTARHFLTQEKQSCHTQYRTATHRSFVDHDNDPSLNDLDARCLEVVS